ncbi:MAG: LacI family DNA-binding transcriptional regulator [Bacteroidales bacterium]|nr:LacI family DNA-binding transcriptional regulator [Bacteroidales bacterium]
MKNTSLSDIARKLGVSTTLVSLVLNGKSKESRINKEMAQKVLKTASEMNYKPNQLARGLRTGKTHTLALIVADISNIFFARLARVIEDEAGKFGYKVMFGSSDENPEELDEMLNIFQERKVDGFIISPTIGSAKFITELKKKNIPFVLIDRYFPKIKSNYVIVDNYNASYRATSHLLKFGYKRIGTLTISPELSQMRDRMSGFKQALRDEGIRFENKFVGDIEYNDLRESVFENVKKLLSPPLNARALYFQNYILGVAGLECIKEMKLRVPLDVAVVCFDDPIEFRLFETPITAIKQPVEEIGEQAVRILLDELNGSSTGERNVVLPTQFHVRRSCGNLDFL